MAAANFPTSPSNNDTHTVGSAEYTFDSTKGVWNNTTTPIVSYSIQDGELSQNNFTNADHSKLDGIETSATADQTNAEIKIAVQAEANIALGGNPTTTTQTAGNNSTRVATTAYADAAASPKLSTTDFTTTANTWAGVLAAHLVPVVAAGETVSVYDLGSSTHKWRDIHMSGDTLNIGTQTIKATSSGIQLPEISIGTGTNKVVLAVATDGSMATTSTDSSGNTSAAVKSLTAGSHTEIRDAVEAASDSHTFNDADHTKLNNIETAATADQTSAQLLTAIKTVDGAASALDADLLDGQHGSYYTGYTDTAVSNLVDSSPASLNTLNELAAALGDDASFSTTVTNSIAAKLPLSGGAMTGAITTNSTFDGRNVSTDGTKLDGIAASANNYVHPSLNHIPAGGASGQVLSYASGGTAAWAALPAAYSLPTSSSSTLGGVKVGTNLSINGSGVLSATDTNTTYSIQDGELSQNNFTNADHSKLDGIAASANNYAHPSLNHIPTGGSAGQVLTYASGGTAQWGTQVTAYTLPTSSSSTLGGVKVGTNLSINGSGVLSATDTNTVYSVQDGQLSQKNFTTTLKSKLDGIAASANNFTYSHPTGAGNNHVPTGGASGQFLKYSASGVAVWANPTATYTDANAVSAVVASDLNMGSNDITTTGKMLFANMYAAVSDLPSATTYHGMFAHVHATQLAYYAHAGAWVPLARLSDTAHATGAGHNHIPTGGSSNQVLTYSASGVAVWANAASGFTLPTSSASTLGGVKVGTNLSINGSGVLSATDTNTTYSIQDGELSQNNFTNADHSKLDGVAASANNYAHPSLNHIPTGGTSGQILTYSSSGTAQWTALTNATSGFTLPTSSASTLGGVKIGANLSINGSGVLSATDTDTDTVYTHPTTNGNKHIPVNGASGQFLKYDSAGTAVWAADNDTVYTHPTTAGNNHVPTGGSAGQVLQYAASGVAAWATAAGGATAGVFYQNDATLAVSHSIPTNKNAVSAGPITIASGVTVTVPSGSRWSVI